MFVKLFFIILFTFSSNFLVSQSVFICANDSVQSFSVLSVQNSNYDWEFLNSNSQVLSGNGTSSVNVVLRGEGDVILRVTETDGNGCSGYSGLVIYLYSEPDLSFIINGNCLGSETFFINTSSSFDSIISYYWYLDEGFYSNQISPTYTYNQLGDYNISLLANTVNGCESNLDTMITIFDNIDADFSFYPESTTILNSEVNFMNYSLGDISSFYWDFGDGNYSNLENPIHEYDSVGYFNVELLIANSNQCQDSASYQVVIKPDFTIYIPDAFTPNQDGVNDFFEVSGLLSYIKSYNLKVFNQWGDLVFESIDYQDSWDGYDFKGFKMPLDTYVWKIYIEDYLGKINLLTGKVLLAK